MTLAGNPSSLPATSAPADSTSNALSIFSPNANGPRTEFSNSDLNALIANAMSSTLTNYNNAAAAAAAAGNTGEQQNGYTANDESADNSAADQLDFIDDDLPLLSDSESYNFGEGEEVYIELLSLSELVRRGSCSPIVLCVRLFALAMRSSSKS